MAYYGILMKDGTELTHYGVKGMKWGKHIFGKVKGVFGKPETSVREYGKSVSDKQISSSYKAQNDKMANAARSGDSSKFHNSVQIATSYDKMLKNRQIRMGETDPNNFASKYFGNKEKKAANKIKKRSKRINGR